MILKIRETNLGEKQKTFNTGQSGEVMMRITAVAEEYINCFDYGEYELTKNFRLTSGDSLRSFLSDESF